MRIRITVFRSNFVGANLVFSIFDCLDVRYLIINFEPDSNNLLIDSIAQN